MMQTRYINSGFLLHLILYLGFALVSGMNAQGIATTCTNVQLLSSPFMDKIFCFAC